MRAAIAFAPYPELTLRLGARLYARLLMWQRPHEDAPFYEQHFTGGFPLVIGSDLAFLEDNLPALFATVSLYLSRSNEAHFILAYQSRSAAGDQRVRKEAETCGLSVHEIALDTFMSTLPAEPIRLCKYTRHRQ